MPLTALVTAKQHRVPYGDDKEDPTVFVFQAISARAMAYIRDATVSVSFGTGEEANLGNTSVQTKSGLSILLTAQFGLIDIENFLDANGKPMKIKTTVVDLGQGQKWKCVAPEVLDMLPDGVRSWCANQVQRLSQPSEEEVKN
jgi:hypothetical protein